MLDNNGRQESLLAKFAGGAPSLISELLTRGCGV
jgi:hypothetical protein